MTTFRTRSTTTYKRYTPVQLASTIRQLKKQCISTSKKNTNTRGKTTVQQCTAIVSEIKKVATVLRSKTVQQINAKIRTLRSDYAKKTGVKVSSPKTKTVAVKRLQAKIKQINQCRRVSTLISICTGVKLATYQNPVVRNAVRSTSSTRTRSRTGRRTTARRVTRNQSASHAKYKRQAKSLKKEVHKLKRRNSFMRRLVNQFRKKVAKLQRSYRARGAQPRWRVINGRGTSNVVRFNRASTTSWNRQAKRRAG